MSDNKREYEKPTSVRLSKESKEMLDTIHKRLYDLFGIESSNTNVFSSMIRLYYNFLNNLDEKEVEQFLEKQFKKILESEDK